MVAQPIEMQAPAAAYTVFYVIFAVSMVASIGWLAWRAHATRSSLPLAAIAGGLAVGAVMPSIYNALTMCWFPDNIPGTFVTAFGMRDPLFDVAGYVLFIGFGGWVLCEQLRAGLGSRAIWLTFVSWGVADLLFELPFLEWGMYTYYGDQPFSVGGFPIHWVFMNGTVPVIAGVLMFVMADRWPFGEGRASLRVATAPALAGGLLLVPMAPVATALHADVASWLREAAALASIAISLATMRFLAARFPVRRPQPAAAAATRSPLPGAAA